MCKFLFLLIFIAQLKDCIAICNQLPSSCDCPTGAIICNGGFDKYDVSALEVPEYVIGLEITLLDLRNNT